MTQVKQLGTYYTLEIDDPMQVVHGKDKSWMKRAKIKSNLSSSGPWTFGDGKPFDISKFYAMVNKKIAQGYCDFEATHRGLDWLRDNGYSLIATKQQLKNIKAADRDLQPKAHLNVEIDGEPYTIEGRSWGSWISKPKDFKVVEHKEKYGCWYSFETP